MSQVAEWIEKLDAMSADEIAELFKAENVTGLAGWVDDCPIANFLKTKGDVAYVHVGGTMVHWAEMVPNAGGLEYRNNLTRAQSGIPDFVRRFDGGEYPELYRKNNTGDYDDVLYRIMLKEMAKQNAAAAELLSKNLNPA